MKPSVNHQLDDDTLTRVDRLLADSVRGHAHQLERATAKLREFAALLDDDNLGQNDRAALLQFLNDDDAESFIVLEVEACVMRVRVQDESLARINVARVARLAASLGLILPYSRYVDVLSRPTTRQPVCELVVDGLAWRADNSSPEAEDRLDRVQKLMGAAGKREKRKKTSVI